MQEVTSLRISRTMPGAEKSGVCLVHAMVHEVTGRAGAMDTALMRKLIRRRLTRLERVLTAHGGALVEQMPEGLLASFDTAEDAVLVACEMQRRCAVIPQISDSQIALKIGIHMTVADRISVDLFNPTTLIKEGCLLVSGRVVDALPPTLCDKAAPISADDSQLPVYAIDWNAVPMIRTPTPKTESVPGMQEIYAEESPAIELHHAGIVLRFGANHPLISIGRDRTNNIVINDRNASRQHCQIIFQAGSFVLVDLSLNGTHIYFHDDTRLLLRKNTAPLIKGGRLGFGHAVSADGAQSFEFDIIP